jgi:hypothetical protein
MSTAFPGGNYPTPDTITIRNRVFRKKPAFIGYNKESAR